MANQYLLAIDQGTTGTTTLVIKLGDNVAPEVIGRKTVDFKQHYPQPGWVEHDLNEIWQSLESAAEGALNQAAAAGVERQQITAIGITNQRETLCTFEKGSGKPLEKAIVWQCKRSMSICDRLKGEGVENIFREKTGLCLDPYFSGTKMTWLMENRPQVAEGIRSGTALWGTIDTWLLYRLSGAATYATEPSNASRTLAFDIRKNQFDPELAEILGLPHLDCLPEVRDSAGLFGQTKGLGFLPDGIPITGILGDQQAALAGQGCYQTGSAKCTYGTGAFMLLNTGSEMTLSSSGLLTTVAWSLKGSLTYALEGSSFIAGAAVQFMRDQLSLIETAEQTADLAKDVIGAPEVYFVPALAGLGAPIWNPRAKGAFFGLTRGTDQRQMVRAALEGIAFQVSDLLKAMCKDFNVDFSELRVDGGAAAND
ncbi:MAG: glycerol kinase, partial [Zetaproteobacteria bacterium]|nr:glycerol kinase [Pseudobdellovibrionaceae bacterium]